MSWTQIFSDSFARADAASLSNGWLDPYGSASIASGKGKWAFIPAAYNGAGWVYRPTSENQLDQRIVLTLTGPAAASGQAFYGLIRGNGTNNAYIFGLNPSTNDVQCYAIVGGSIVAIGLNSTAITGGYQAGHGISLDCQATGSNPTTLAFTLTDTTTSTVVATATATDSTSALQSAGYSGMFVNGYAGSYNSFTSYQQSGAPTGVAIGPDNAGIAYSGRWAVNSTRALTINCGSVLEFGYLGDTCSVNFDVSGLTDGAYPEVIIQVDSDAPARYPLASGTAIVLSPTYTSSTSVRATAHRVRVWAAGVYEGAGGTPGNVNQWASQLAALKFTGLTLAAGGSMLPAPPAGDSMEFLGDSITASVGLLRVSAYGQSVMDGSASWPAQVARMLGLSPVVVGFGGTGVTVGGSGSVPAAPTTFPLVIPGVAWNPTRKPAVVVIYDGTNESGVSQGTYQPAYLAYLQLIRAAYPSAAIFAVVPLTCPGLSPAISGAVSQMADARVAFLDYSTAGSPKYTLNVDTADSVGHVNPGGAAKLAAALAADVRAGLDSMGIKVGDGSDRWSDPGQSNVVAGVPYKANSATNNRTGSHVDSGGSGPTLEQIVAAVGPAAVWAYAGRTLSAFGFSVNLASTGLDAIPTTPQAPGASPNFRQMVVMTWRRWFKRATASGGSLICYADDNSTPLTTQAVPTTGAAQTQGVAT